MSREMRGAGDWVQSPMANEVINHAYAMNPLEKDKKLEFWELPSQFMNIGRFGESSMLREGIESPRPYPHTLPYVSLSLAGNLCPLIPFVTSSIVSKSVSWVLWAPENELNARRRSWKPLMSGLLVRSTGDDLDSWLASEVKSSLVGLSPSPMGSDATCR